MMKLIQRRMVLFGGLLIGTAIIIACLFRGYNPVRSLFLNKNNASQQKGDPTGVKGEASEGGIAGASGSLVRNMPGAGTDNTIATLEKFLKALSRGDEESASILSEVMIQSLHKNPDGDWLFYQRAKQVLEDASIGARSKERLIFIIDRAATPEAIKLLAELCQRGVPSELKTSAYSAIANTGQYFWDKESLPKAIPILQQMWNQSDDPDLLNAVAKALATIGNPDSIEYLVDEALSNNKAMADIENSRDPSVKAAWQSLKNMQKIDIIPFFEEKLQSSTSKLELSVYAELLAESGQISASEALLSWAQSAGDQYAAIAQNAFGSIVSYECLQHINSMLAQNAAFKSSHVKKAVLSALKK